jgi:hypothetical protein
MNLHHDEDGEDFYLHDYPEECSDGLSDEKNEEQKGEQQETVAS